MVPAAVFTLILLALLSFRKGRGDRGRIMFVLATIATLLLFLHHVTDPLNLSF